MRRRRQPLRVDTFPFLAVLLCAMGSLILVLLVMDRKSRRAAQAKANDLARRQVNDLLDAQARRKAEADQRRQANKLHWEKKRETIKSRVLAEEKALEGELALVRARLAEAVRRLCQEEDAVEKLRNRLQAQRQRLGGKEEALAAAQREAAGAAAQAAATDRVKAKLSQDLVQLEQKLNELRAARQRDAQTYSVIPYHGKRGEARRPLYVECAADGLVFHPDGQRMNPTVNPTAVRAEVERRVGEQGKGLREQGVADVRPYLLLLVRPDGVARYYQLQAAVRGLPLEFGYEFVDADWVLHFPEKGAAPPPAIAARPSAPPARPAASGRAAPGGLAASVGLSRPQAYGAATRGAAGRPAPAHPDAPLPSAAIPTPPNVPVLAQAEPRVSAAGSAGGPTLPRPPHPVADAPGSTPRGSTAPGSSAPRSSAPRSTQPGTGSVSDRVAVPPARRPVPLRPAALSDASEYVVFVECQRDRVVIHPGRTTVAVEALNHSPAHNRLYQTVLTRIRQRLSVVPPGGRPPRLQIRFLVHGDAEQTFHLAYPALDPLRQVDKTRSMLQPEDEVDRIVAGQ